MTTRELTVESAGPQVVVVTINRLGVHNALNSALIEELSGCVATLARAGDARAIVLTGAGEKAFSAGADLGELTGLGREEAAEVLARGQAAYRTIERCGVPVIAAVNGVALGGGFELVLACSFPVLSERASLGLPETGLGLIPGYGGTQRLTRAVGPAVARFVMLSGARISADQAFRWGLTPVPPVAPPDLVTRAVELAEGIAARGPLANADVLRLVDLAGDCDLDDGLRTETDSAARAVSSREGTEGIDAFTSKRTPQFEGLR